MKTIYPDISSYIDLVHCSGNLASESELDRFSIVSDSDSFRKEKYDQMR